MTGAQGAPRVSVVIPVLDDCVSLAALLDSLTRVAERPTEIIVVDGGSNTQCRDAALRHGAVYLPTSPGRGRQLHAGALRANGDVLWFLHADATPPASGVRAIREALAAGACGGYFRFGFSGERRWFKRVLAALINWRCRIGVPYGDQGLFVARDAYEAVGGFAPVPLFEEVPLIRALRRRGRFDCRGETIGVSPRRWERDGWLRRSFANRALAVGYLLGISPERLARSYWRDNAGAGNGPRRDS